MKGPPALNPLNWHCFRFALGHHLFQHPLSPYDERRAQDVAKLLPRMKEQASAATTTTHPLFMTPFTSDELKNMRSTNCTQTNRRAPLASLTECYKLATLISKDSSSSSSTVCGNFTPNLQTGNFLFYNPYTKDTTWQRQNRSRILQRYISQ